MTIDAIALHPTHSLILRCCVSGLEGALQIPPRCLEPSFEGAAARRHLRMRGWVGDDTVAGAQP